LPRRRHRRKAARRRPPRRRRRSHPSRRRPSLDLLGWSKPSGPRNPRLQLRLKKHRRWQLRHRRLLRRRPHPRRLKCPSLPNHYVSSRRHRPSLNRLRPLRLRLHQRSKRLRLKRLHRSRTLSHGSCRRRFGSASRSLASRRSLRVRCCRPSARSCRSPAWCNRLLPRRRRPRRRHRPHVLQAPPAEAVRQVRRARHIRRRRVRRRRACWEDRARFRRNQSAHSRARRRDRECPVFVRQGHVRRCRRFRGRAHVLLPRGGNARPHRPPLQCQRPHRQLRGRSRSPRG
jgi:hypothetical protein